MRDLRRAAIEELTHRILPFWSRLRDDEYGGFYGQVHRDLTVNRLADKGGVVGCRSLWTFSAAYNSLRDPAYLDLARWLYAFVVDRLIDQEQGGVFWSVDHKGSPANAGKHVYAQAFAIYALSEYYRATQEQEALDHAMRLFELVERHGFDPDANAYLEQFDREWAEVPNEHLSDRGVMASVTMNTHLHIMEAYANLYRARPTPAVGQRIANVLDIFHDRIYNSGARSFQVFFNKRWESLLDMCSFGHDIEATWLFEDAARAIGCDRQEHWRMTTDAAYQVAACGIQEDGSLCHERIAERWDRTRIWWVQAEAVVGFLNAFERTADDRFAALACGVWDFIQRRLVDPRPGGEWFWSIQPDGSVSPENVAGLWKCSYHNARACLEIMRRTTCTTIT